METWPEEAAGCSWRRERIVDVVAALMNASGVPDERPFILGIDGRSSSGKTSLANRIHEAVPNSSIVHTDDVAWHHSFFGWTDLIIDGVLVPLRKGGAVQYRPPAWTERSRAGAIEVPAGRRLVVVEGVGVGRRELAHLLDAVVWVRCDRAEVERREAARVAAGEVEKSIQDQWQREEVPFLADQRPWERAALIVAGGPEIPHDPQSEILVSEQGNPP